MANTFQYKIEYLDKLPVYRYVKSLKSGKIIASRVKVENFSLYQRSQGMWVKVASYRKIKGVWRDVSMPNNKEDN